MEVSMIKIKTTEKMAGIRLSGTYSDLNYLYDAISNVIGMEGSYKGYLGSQYYMLGLLYEIRHAYSGDRGTGKNEFNEKIYSVEFPWPHMLFAFDVLDDFISLCTDLANCLKMSVDSQHSIELLDKLPDDIAYVYYFRSLIINEFERVADSKRVTKILGALSCEGRSSMVKRNYYSFCTQWTDILTVKYLKHAPEKRKTYLATIAEKLFFENSEYDVLDRELKDYATENKVPYFEIEVEGFEYPEEIEW